jgi:hypothetical protein
MAKFSVAPPTYRANKRNVLERIFDDTLRPEHSRNWGRIMSAPTSSGCRGMGDSVGAALSSGESGPDFITPLTA